MLRDFSSAAQEYTSRIGLWSKLSRKKPYSLLTPDHHILQILFGFSFFFFFWVCAQSCPTFSDCRTVAYQALLPMEFSRQEYWSALPFSNPGDFPKCESPMSSALAGRLFFFFKPLHLLGSLFSNPLSSKMGGRRGNEESILHVIWR